MAGPTLTVDAYDLSSLILWGDRPPDPFDQPLSPQFGGNTAFNDGQSWARTSAKNRAWSLPLLLDGGTDAVHALVRSINSHLFQGAQVAFKPQGATNTSYFDLETGVLEPHWDLYIDNAGALKATLNLYTRPYAYSGTARGVASITGTGPLQFAVTGITGDINALARLEVRVGSLADASSFVAYGIHQSASFVAIHPGASIIDRLASSVVTGASGRIASQYLSMILTATSTDNGGNRLNASPLARDYLTPAGGYIGRHRVLLIGRHQIQAAASAPVLLYAKDRFGALLGPTQIMGGFAMGAAAPPGGASAFQAYDLGEIQVTSPPTGVEGIATQYVEVYADIVGGLPASAVASPAFSINALIYLPVGDGAGLARPSTLTARDWLQFQSHPQARAQRSSASIFQNSILTGHRGNLPQIPITGSPGASGAAQMVVIAGKGADFVGNDVIDVNLSAIERFSYLR